MRRRLVWLIALAGLVWLYLRRGVRRPQPVVQIPPAADPAEELRRKLAETRGSVDAPEPVTARDEELDDRRARVHAQARETIDAMADGDPS